MALSSTTNWEIRSGGNAANGGGFNPGNANMLTDAAATSATGNAPVITSATYNFVAGDVGAWVYIKAGTNWTPGWYKISSVASNAATVDATIGQAIQVVAGKFTPSTVAGCATTASPTGGTFAVDYSQQNAAKLTLTDLASTGSSLNLTSATGGFTPVMVGNLIQISTTGVGGFFIVGWYEIVSYTNGNSVVVDVTTNSGTAGVGGTGSVGGGILTVGAIGSATARLGAVAGNTIFFNGSFSLGGNDLTAFAGSSTSPIKLLGYGTYRGDGYLGRTNTNGALILTNMPTLTYSAGFRLNFTGSWIITESLNLVGSANTTIIQLAADSAVVRCRVENAGTGAAARAIAADDIRDVAFECDAILSGASGGACAIDLGTSGAKADTCRVTVTSATAPGILYVAYTVIYGCTVYVNGGVGIQAASTTAGAFLRNNTVVGNAGDGFDIPASSTVLTFLVGNMSTDNGGYGFDLNNANVGTFTAYNRTRDNTAGAYNLGTGWVNATNYNAVTTDTGTGTSDYVSPGSSNFNYLLISTSPAVNAAGPSKASMGANQFVGSGSGGQKSSVFGG